MPDPRCSGPGCAREQRNPWQRVWAAQGAVADMHPEQDRSRILNAGSARQMKHSTVGMVSPERFQLSKKQGSGARAHMVLAGVREHLWVSAGIP